MIKLNKNNHLMLRNHLTLFLLLTVNLLVFATDYHVGPGQAYSNISDVPLESLQAGDKVFIHYRAAAYKEKWVITAQGTAANPIEFIGVSSSGGQKPIIDGNGATTRTALDFWNEDRGVIKIGGSSNPTNILPSYIIIENLEIRSSRPAYQFLDDRGNTRTYRSNAAAVYIERGEHITIRNCDIHDAGNGIFIGASDGQTQDILITSNYIFNNGIMGSGFQHNTYTEAVNITYEFNRFGPLRAGAEGNNLKDRSAGLIVRYNWIEDGSRLLDLVDSNNSNLTGHPTYGTTYVYGNILIKEDDQSNNGVIHYGGDSGNTANYRKGDLYFYNNTVISTRPGNTTLVNLDTQDETMHAFNNVIYLAESGSSMALVTDNGTLNMQNNWLKSGWRGSHGSLLGTINDLGDNLEGSDPLFTDFANEDFSLLDSSPLINAGDAIPGIHLPDHDLLYEYVMHSNGMAKSIVAAIDIGAYEYQSALPVELSSFIGRTAGKQNILEWTTASEEAFSHYELERSPGDIANWEMLGAVGGAGQAGRAQSYTYTDVTPPNFAYYRLRVVDLDGSFAYSNIVHLEQAPSAGNLAVYPNPSNGQFTVQLPTDESAMLTLYDLNGRTIWQRKATSEVSVASLPDGVYLLSATTASNRWAKRIVVR
jgi:hypothetical protein